MSESPLDLHRTFRAVIEAAGEVGVSHAFIGALPVLAWGRVRATTDLDVVVLAGNDWSRLTSALRARGLEQARSIGPADAADALPDIAVFKSAGERGARVDVFVAKTDFEREVIATAREATVFGLCVRLACPEASIIYKLLAQRRKDVEDVESIFEARAVAGDVLDWAFLEKWAAVWGISDRLSSYRARFGPRR